MHLKIYDAKYEMKVWFRTSKSKNILPRVLGLELSSFIINYQKVRMLRKTNFIGLLKLHSFHEKCNISGKCLLGSHFSKNDYFLYLTKI